MLLELRLALREIFGSPRFSLFFVLNISLGLSGFVALDAFKLSIDGALGDKSKSILTADLSLSARGPISNVEAERAESYLPADFQKTSVIESYSMVVSKSQSRLVQLKAIEPEYPFYGDVELKKSGSIKNIDKSDFFKGSAIWVYPELLAQLDLQVGDPLKIGSREFIVADTIEQDSANAISTGMAPKIYMSKKNLMDTGLIRFGSTAYYSQLYKVSETFDADDIVAQIEPTVEDPGLRVVSHSQASEQVGRLLGYLNDYLGLTAIVALFLAGLGASFLFRSFLLKRLKEIATLLSLGASRKTAVSVYAWQLVLLGLAASIPTIAVSYFLLPWIGYVVDQFVPSGIHSALQWRSALLALFMGGFGSLMICLPLLAKIQTIKPALLFRENSKVDTTFSLSQVAYFVPAILAFLGLAIWQANSWKVGTLFTGVFLLCALLGLGLGTFLLKILENFREQKSLLWRHSLRNIVRSKTATLSSFLAIALGTLLLNLIPQLQASLAKELESPKESKLPSLFLFDIQDDQLSPLEEKVKTLNTQLDSLSPMIRARILRVNGKDFEKSNANSSAFSREEQQEMRFRNRGFNLTYRSHLTESESIIKGRQFSGTYQAGSDNPAEISMEIRFANRLGLKMGDVLTFDVQDVEITGQIVNFRKVRWTSFQPNFFVQFQPGVLEPAPKTFLASIPKLTDAEKITVQNEIVSGFPNVSIIDVSRIVERITGIISQMSWALKFMAILATLAGFVVLFSIANHQVHERLWEVNLLKVLGAPFDFVFKIFYLEYVLISVAATLLGVGLSLVFSYLVSTLMFDSLWVFDSTYPMATLLGVAIVSLILTHYAVKKTLLRKATFN